MRNLSRDVPIAVRSKCSESPNFGFNSKIENQGASRKGNGLGKLYPRWFLIGMAISGMSVQASSRTHSPMEARSLFSEARRICEGDGGRLWGRSLCGPILLTDGQTRRTTANQADSDGKLVKHGDVFEGILPDDVLIANSPTEWSGTRWTQLILPLPSQADDLRVLIGHELFHRVQSDIGLSRPDGGNNHLNARDGRFFIQLEWRALARALQARSSAQRRMAISDAMAFRHERYRLYPAARTEEGHLEVAEGIAEYTGVMVGISSPAGRTAYAVRDLTKFVNAPTFVRSFAYATGPALGLLLDQIRPTWKAEVKAGRYPADLLARSVIAGKGTALASRVRRYDDGALQRSEDVREQARLALMTNYRRELIERPVLVIPLHSPRRQFNPQTLVPLDGEGTVYPTMRLVDDWGVLEVESGGALYDDLRQRATVSLFGFDRSAGRGRGWLIKLNPGWSIQAGNRPDDLKVGRDPAK